MRKQSLFMFFFGICAVVQAQDNKKIVRSDSAEFFNIYALKTFSADIANGLRHHDVSNNVELSALKVSRDNLARTHGTDGFTIVRGVIKPATCFLNDNNVKYSDSTVLKFDYLDNYLNTNYPVDMPNALRNRYGADNVNMPILKLSGDNISPMPGTERLDTKKSFGTSRSQILRNINK